MSEGLVPTSQSPRAFTADSLEPRAPTFDGPPPGPMERPIAAIRRYRWVIAALTVVGAAFGFAGSRFITPKYQVRATVWVAIAPTGQGAAAAGRTGPIRAAELLSSNAWIELFRSYRVVDEVVRKLTLHVTPEDPNDRTIFADFRLADRFAPGSYELVLNRTNKTWSLSSRSGAQVDGGSGLASIGSKVGFLWTIPDSAYQGVGQRVVRFTVVPPRDRSLDMLNRVEPRMALGSNFLWLTYSDVNRRRAQRTLNTWVAEFVNVAADLKKRNLVEFSRILEGQLRFAERATQDAESAYQSFRVNTIILPTEGGPVAAGVTGVTGGAGADRDPALSSFFEQKIEYDNLRHDRQALEQTIASAVAGTTPYEGLLFIPSVAQSPGAEALRDAFRTQYGLEADLRVKRQTFTDQHPAVMEVNAALDVLRAQTIPYLAGQLLQQLKERENDYERRIQAASHELRQIPPRTIEERRLNRAVSVSEALYTNLKSRYAEAQLAEAGATPDVSVLDTAVAPLAPTTNTATMILLGGILGGLVAAVVLAILLDQIDPKIRYAHQASTDLGLVIAATVPKIPKTGIDAKSPDQVLQFLESFRTLRLHVMHSGPGPRLTLAVTSAAPGDGKSLIAANLALSFAEAGLKTVLVDGDTRRGALHRLYGLKPAGGLTEYLQGGIDERQAVRATTHPNLFFVSSGSRHARSPELLTSSRLQRFVQQLSDAYDVVIVDTPPLAAGIDAYAISAVAGRVLMVLRMGQTERRLAAAKLATLDRLPVEVVGAVLNAVPRTPEFQYYVYSPGYSSTAEPTVGGLVTTR